MVLAPLFWLQSMKTLPSRSERFIELITRSRWSASSARASSRATAVACSGDCDPSSGAYRWMPLLPEVTGTGSWPMSRRMSRTSRAISAQSVRLTPGPGSRSSTSRSGLRGWPLRPNRHCGTWISSAASWASQVRVARSLTTG